MVLHVQQKMFVKLYGSKDMKAAARSKKRSNQIVVEEDMPEQCAFSGLFVFILFAPHGTPDFKLSCLSEDGKGVAMTGRKVAREAEIEQR